MCLSRFDELTTAIRKCYEKSFIMPIKIKMNEDFFNQLVEEMPIVVHEGEPIKYFKTFRGIPFEIDNNVATYEFVWSEDIYRM